MELVNTKTDRLDKHIQEISIAAPPQKGWLRGLRQTLNMNLEQLSQRLGVSKQSVARLEANELDGSITLRSLRRAAEAMDCRVVYAVLPNAGSFRSLVEQQAEAKARSLLSSVAHTMALEGQASPQTEAQLQELIAEYVRDLPRDLWND